MPSTLAIGIIAASTRPPIQSIAPASLAERSRSDASLELGIIYQQPLTLSLSADLGEVSAVYQRPAAPVALLVLAHGAGAGMQHEHMQSLADAFAEARIASLRFNFPFMESSRKPPNPMGICLVSLEAAVNLGARLAAGLPLYIGGHSFGGRMASHYVEQSQDARCSGLIYCSFPLHPSGKPGVSRAEHLTRIQIPQLFLSGTRDSLAEPDLLRGVTEAIPMASLSWLATADHSFKQLKGRKRQRDSGVPATISAYTSAATATLDWLRHHPNPS